MVSLSLPTFFTKYGALISGRIRRLRTRQNVANDKDGILSHVFGGGSDELEGRKTAQDVQRHGP
jgi:hypothetical protein